MNGQENLVPFAERTEEEQRDIRIKGGKASGEARRAKATFKAAILAVLDQKTPEGLTKREALVLKAITNAYKKGELKDVKTLAELTGELEQKMEVSATTTQIVVDGDTASHLAHLLHKEEE